MVEVQKGQFVSRRSFLLSAGATICTPSLLIGCSDRRVGSPRGVVPTPPPTFAVASSYHNIEGGKSFIYQDGAIVNMLTPSTIVSINAEVLGRYNSDPRFGINLPNNEANLTFLVGESLQDPAAKAALEARIGTSMPSVLSRYAAEFNRQRGIPRLSVLSLPDILRYVIAINPQSYPQNSPFPFTMRPVFLQLNLSYVEATRRATRQISDIPAEVLLPEVPVRVLVNDSEYLGLLLREMDPNYIYTAYQTR